MLVRLWHTAVPCQCRAKVDHIFSSSVCSGDVSEELEEDESGDENEELESGSLQRDIPENKEEIGDPTREANQANTLQCQELLKGNVCA